MLRDQPDDEKVSDTFEAQLQPGDVILLYVGDDLTTHPCDPSLRVFLAES